MRHFSSYDKISIRDENKRILIKTSNYSTIPAKYDLFGQIFEKENSKEFLNKTAINYKLTLEDEKYSEYKKMTYNELFEKVNIFAQFLDQNTQKQEFQDEDPHKVVLICSFPNVENVCSILSCPLKKILYMNIHTIPIREKFEKLLDKIKSDLICVSTVSLTALAEYVSVSDTHGNLKNVVLFDYSDRRKIDTLAIETLTKKGMKVHLFSDIIKATPIEKPLSSYDFPVGDDLVLIASTSGSTGNPKYVGMSVNIIMTDIYGLQLSGYEITSRDIFAVEDYLFCTVPLDGVYLTLYCGGEILLLSEVVRQDLITKDFDEISPTLFYSTPIFVKAKFKESAKYIESLKESDRAKLEKELDQRRAWLRECISKNNLKDYFDKAAPENFESYLIDKAMSKHFHELRRPFGSKLKIHFTCGVAVSMKVFEDYLLYTGSYLVSEFGANETGANLIDKIHHIERNCMGFILPFFEYKLTPISNDKYDLRFRWSWRKKCYFDSPEINHKAFDDEGFYILNDVVSLSNISEALIFEDRVQNVIKLSFGTKLFPAYIEGVLSASNFVEKMIVCIKDDNSDFLCAVIEPRLAAFGFDCDNLDEEKYRDCIRKINPEHIEEIIKDLDRIARENLMEVDEYVKRIILSYFPFTKSNGMMTETNKVNRVEIKKRYLEEINKLYS